MKDLKILARWMIVGFLVAMSIHFGANTAKMIWPIPSIKLEYVEYKGEVDG